ncbi:MAG: MazG nucleotide pyrophosphohydrolase domain-containing protein [Culicoidibacterales bacterium]
MELSSLKNRVLHTLNQTSIDNDRWQLIQKLNEETLELSLAIRDQDIQNVKEEIADVLIVLVQIMDQVEFTQTDLNNKLWDVLKRYEKNKAQSWTGCSSDEK